MPSAKSRYARNPASFVRTLGAAEILGLDPRTLDNWRAKAKGPPYYKVGAAVLYNPSEVKAWLAAQRSARIGELAE